MTDAEILGKLKGVSVPMEDGTLPVGAVLGDWRLTAFLARGGTAEVYCAEHVVLGTSAAVKILAMKATAVRRERFIREARLLAELKSSAFPRFLAYGEAEGRPYLVEELLEPRDLPETDHAVACYLVRLCKGLAELHGRGIVHRDLKPANILFRGNDEPVIVDLGLSSDAPFGEGAGTPGYSAPEQFTGEAVMPTADIHALGVLVNACFGGHPPHPWREIVRHATSSIASERYASVVAFARAIRLRHLRRLVWTVVGALVGVSVAIVIIARWSESRMPDTINLNCQKVVLKEPLVIGPGRMIRVVGPGTLDAVIEGSKTAMLWMTNCVVLNRAKVIFPEVGLKYKLNQGTYLNFTEIRHTLSPNLAEKYILPYDRAKSEVRYHGPETLADLVERHNFEHFESFRRKR